MKTQSYPSFEKITRPQAHSPKDCSALTISKKKVNEVTPQPWQQECRKKLFGKRFTLVCAPCASGKSIMILLLAVDEVVASKFKQKQLIVVPQEVIAQSFTKERRILNGKTYTWLPSNDFFNIDTSVLVALKKWLLTDAKKLRNSSDPCKIDGLTAVTSQQALSIVWNGTARFRGLTKAQKRKAIHNLTLTVDEGHHIKGVFLDDKDGLTAAEKKEVNLLAAPVHAMVNSHDKTAHVRLTTATFFRGDARKILHKEVAKLFADGTYCLSLEDYYPSLKFKKFRIEYRPYELDPIKSALNEIKKNPNHMYLIYIPSEGHGWRTKTLFKRLMKDLLKIVPEEFVLDLVTQGAIQRRNKNRFITDSNAVNSGYKPSFKVIVACGIGLEGADYPPADRLLNLAVQNSPTKAVQVTGRVMREYPTKEVKQAFVDKGSPVPPQKTDVRAINYIRQFAAVTKDNMRESLSDRTAGLMVCMIYDDFLNPIRLKMSKLRGKEKVKSERMSERMTLDEALGLDYQVVVEEVLKAAEGIEKKTTEALTAMIHEVLADNSVTLNKDDITDGLLVRIRRAQLRSVAPSTFLYDISMLRTKKGYDIIKRYDLLHRTIFYGDLNAKELKTVKRLEKELREELYAEAEAKIKAYVALRSE